MKKVIIVLISIVSILGLVGCEKNVDTPSEQNLDAIKFKEEYEALNNEINKSGKVIRSVTIKEDNPFYYATAADIVSKINNKETFYVYFGFASCPWCRSMITTLIDAASELGISKIYYVDVLNIRDTITVEDGKPVRTKEGEPAYMELIGLLDNVLSNYSLKDSDGVSVDAKEKRIYAPNVVAIKDGKAIKLTEGVSGDLKDPYGTITTEMLEESYDMLKDTLSSIGNVCKDKC